ncbi:hypothetical protein ACWJJH_02160 [Endozoicomonadaceae bacterium StTr2]
MVYVQSRCFGIVLKAYNLLFYFIVAVVLVVRTALANAGGSILYDGQIELNQQSHRVRLVASSLMLSPTWYLCDAKGIVFSVINNVGVDVITEVEIQEFDTIYKLRLLDSKLLPEAVWALYTDKEAFISAIKDIHVTSRNRSVILVYPDDQHKQNKSFRVVDDRVRLVSPKLSEDKQNGHSSND